MNYKKIVAAFSAAICLLSCVSCGKGTEISVDEKASESTTASAPDKSNLSVGELIEPDEESEEYNLGSYRIASDGVKLYYDETVPEELMFALDKYFSSFQNNDLEAYKESLYPDFIERYGKFLEEEYKYGIEKSFELSCDNLRSLMQNALAGDEGDPSQYSGDYTITRIKAEAPALNEDETIDDAKKALFEYFHEVFDMDYYEFIKEDSDGIELVCFYIYAEGEDGEEHRLIGSYEIAFALKDGKYYTFG